MDLESMPGFLRRLYVARPACNDSDNLLFLLREQVEAAVLYHLNSTGDVHIAY